MTHPAMSKCGCSGGPVVFQRGEGCLEYHGAATYWPLNDGRRSPVLADREVVYRGALAGIRAGWWPTYGDGRPRHPFCRCGAARLLSGPVPVALYCPRCDRV